MEINRVRVNNHTIVHEYHRKFRKDDSIDLIPNKKYEFLEASGRKVEHLEPFEVDDDRINEKESKEDGLFVKLKKQVDKAKERIEREENANR